MRNTLFLAVAIVASAVVMGCKKNNSQSPPPEEDLLISIDAAALNLTPGPDFTFNLKVESAMPVAGVKIQYDVKGETDNLLYFQGQPIETSNKVTRLNINNLPRQRICICSLTVTSKNKSVNKATIRFRLAYK